MLFRLVQAPDIVPGFFDITDTALLKWTELLVLVLVAGFEYGPLAAIGTLLTSFWAVLFAASFILLRSAGEITRAAGFVRYTLDFENKPFGSIGLVIASVVTILFAIVLSVTRAIQHS